MLGENDHSFVRQLLVQHTGVALDEQQRQVVTARLTSLAKLQNLSGPSALVDALRRSPTGVLLDGVIEALTTHETSFFRDQPAFAALSRQILPGLVQRRLGPRSLSIWSAACSTGQEAYSVAMLLHERFPQLANWQIKIWGTDVSRTVVQKARDGVFTQRELQRGVNDQVRDKYFEPCGNAWRVREFIARTVTWGTFNLSATWPPMAAFDLILLRNVLIYFTGDARARVLEQTARHLAGDGYLLLGTSETTFGSCEALQPVACGSATVYRKATP
jgi:chemotaxis protein methyltransferase CheR